MGLRNVKITREAASADQKAGDEFPDAIKKVTEEKGCLPEQIFNADENVLFFKKKKMPRRTSMSKEEKHTPGLNQ